MDLSCNNWKEVTATEFNKIKLSDLGAVVTIKTTALVVAEYLRTVQDNRADNLRRLAIDEPESCDAAAVVIEILDEAVSQLSTALEYDNNVLSNIYFDYGFPTGFPVNSKEAVQWDLIPSRVLLKKDNLPESFSTHLSNAVDLLDSLDYSPLEQGNEKEA